MELAWHHDPDLTFNRYAHTRLMDLSKVVDRMPDLLSHALPTFGVSTGLNGTTSAEHRTQSRTVPSGPVRT